MARPLRIEYPGAFYHVTSRGNERKPVYRSVGVHSGFVRPPAGSGRALVGDREY